MVLRIMRGMVALVAASLGYSLGYALLKANLLGFFGLEVAYLIIALITLIFAVFGFLIAQRVMQTVIQFTDWFEVRLQRMPMQDLLGGGIGLVFGLIIASLLGYSFSHIPWIGDYLPIIASFLLGYLGMRVGTKKKEELLSVFCFFPRFGKDRAEKQKPEHKYRYKILDTSVIIDGRIADICQSGFIEGILLIPNFVLEELRHIADSPDLLKRNRGRRGLDILNKIQKELDIRVQICERDYEDIAEVDSKLVKLTKEVDGVIITNDYNLNKVAELQGVKVLNINELANALKPVVLPGEEIVVQVIKDGKESGQGIGYLDDGTMIVVDGGKRFIGQNLEVFVTSVLQTAAGRMIFAKPKHQEKRGSSSNHHFGGVNVLG